MGIELRAAEEQDVPGIAALYRGVYGDDYPFKQFYDTGWIKRGVYDRAIRWFVAVSGAEVVGSAATMLAAGDADDQVCEIGRLAVSEKARGHGLGSRLVEAVTEEAASNGDFAFAECRTAHVGSQVIFDRFGFYTVGVEPLCYTIDGYESVVFVCRMSALARALRRPEPRVAGAVEALAQAALGACEVEADAAASDAGALPRRDDEAALTLRPMASNQVYRLLRMSREHFLNPPVFGAFRLEYGHLKIVAHEGRYLVLQRGDDEILGGLGYTWDPTERKIEIFECVAADDAALGSLLQRAVPFLEAEHDPRMLFADVNAHAPRVQQSLIDLGFTPVVYAPSHVYVVGERLDVVKMTKLRQPCELSHWKLTEQVRPLAESIERALLGGAA